MMAERRRSGIPRPVSSAKVSIATVAAKQQANPCSAHMPVVSEENACPAHFNSDNAEITSGAVSNGASTVSAKVHERLQCKPADDKAKTSVKVSFSKPVTTRASMSPTDLQECWKELVSKVRKKQLLESDLKSVKEVISKVEKEMHQKNMSCIEMKEKCVKEKEHLLNEMMVKERQLQNMKRILEHNGFDAASLQSFSRNTEQVEKDRIRASELANELSDLLQRTTSSGKKILKDLTEIIDDCALSDDSLRRSSAPDALIIKHAV